MRRTLAQFVVLTAVAATVLAVGGCGGDAGLIAVEPKIDEVVGHWVASEESTALTGTRSAVTHDRDVSFVVTQAGLQIWSGTVRSVPGELLTPATGSWVRSGDTYSLSNTAGQAATFTWVGTRLLSTTRMGTETIYLWWSKS
jgi:hypothetical protein